VIHEPETSHGVSGFDYHRMKTFPIVALSLFLAVPVLAEANIEPSSGNDVSAMVKKGEVYQLETIAPLMDGPDRVVILEFGPKAWVLVEYEASVLAQGELLPKMRKGKMWVNFDQVVAARKIVPEIPPAPAN